MVFSGYITQHIDSTRVCWKNTCHWNSVMSLKDFVSQIFKYYKILLGYKYESKFHVK